MIYADYDYYANEYFGTMIDSENFSRYALRASQYIDYITQGRAGGCTRLEPVKMACCALAEQYQIAGTANALANRSLGVDAGGAELQSESVGNWSRSYRSGGGSAQAAVQAAAAAQAELYHIAQQYLAHTGLLYRGGRRCNEHVPPHGDSLQVCHRNRSGNAGR